MPENLQDLIDRLLNAISGLGIFLPIGIFVIAQLFSGKDKDKKQHPAETTTRQTPAKPAPTTSAPSPASPGPVVAFPFGPASWMEMNSPARQATPRTTAASSQWGRTFDKQDSEKDGLQWGSVFEDNDGEPIRWASAFESETGKNTYGFERAT